ncbi:G5 domain-containing protein [Macrococcus sp. DPC7161]|uniref:G5 domain-containing protein n=1 Tax=Macrococcus sp. DPC7161 TaxID=2507060 RepID=UPI00100A64E2|nr:G5 domain-containing protein [Macrococcus sp. DPC7161]RXK17905.1 hypothetical protein ER639_06910 [Macrococcus sp. DPC7161]
MKNLIKVTLASAVVLSSAAITTSPVDAAKSNVTYKNIDKKVVVKYKTVKKADANLLEGQSRVVSGKNGYKIKVYKYKYKNGKYVSRTYIKTKKSVSPKSKIVYVGTKKFVDQSQFANIKLESGDVKYKKALSTQAYSALTGNDIAAFNAGAVINTDVLNAEFNKLFNADRKAHGLKPVSYLPSLQAGSDLRAMELVTNAPKLEAQGKSTLSHIRPNGAYPSTAYKGITGKYLFGENILLYSYQGNPYTLVSEKYIASRVFTQFKNNDAHYEVMLRPFYTKSTISVKLGKRSGYNVIYATQGLTSQ